MKLIVAGSTGFVATEVIRQALCRPVITSVVGLARRPTTVPQGVELDADAAKFNSIVCDDFLNYSESVRRELAGADACIWYVQAPSSLRIELLLIVC
jgi:nucleoside-diphosphate-sugar epimerase